MLSILYHNKLSWCNFGWLRNLAYYNTLKFTPRNPFRKHVHDVLNFKMAWYFKAGNLFYYSIRNKVVLIMKNFAVLHDEILHDKDRYIFVL